MPGRPLCSAAEAIARGIGDAAAARRRQILRETLQAFAEANPADRYHRLAQENLARWAARHRDRAGSLRIEVLPGGSPSDPAEARRRIAAQLDTLRAGRVRHAVLSAFGCGAFRNPARQVARIYRQEIAARAADFAVIAFAVFAPGYGPDNYTPFAEVFDRA